VVSRGLERDPELAGDRFGAPPLRKQSKHFGLALSQCHRSRCRVEAPLATRDGEPEGPYDLLTRAERRCVDTQLDASPRGIDDRSVVRTKIGRRERKRLTRSVRPAQRAVGTQQVDRHVQLVERFAKLRPHERKWIGISSWSAGARHRVLSAGGGEAWGGGLSHAT
jgi:hypothetical protein